MAHALLRGGLNAATDIFGPGLHDRLAAAGAVSMNWVTDADWVTCCLHQCRPPALLRVQSTYTN